MKVTFNTQTGRSPNIPQALHIIPPPQLGQDLIGTMEVTIRSLVLDTQHLVALEVAGTASKPSFIIRATTQTALDHVEELLRAEYPHIEIQSLQEKDDPFRLDPHESVSAVELITEEEDGAASAFAHSFKEGRDPLLGLLTVLSKLPDQTRAVVQIALAPVSSTMTTRKLGNTGLLGITDKLVITGILGNSGLLGETGNLGKTGSLGKIGKLGHPIAKVFLASRRSATILALINALLLFLLSLLVGPWLPGWLGSDILEFILLGQFPGLTIPQMLQLICCIVAFLLVEVLFLYATVKVIQGVSLHEEKQSDNKKQDNVKKVIDEKSVYRTRIRFYVIGPKAADEAKKFPLFIPHFRSSGEKKREEVLLRIIASYRQFHAISGIAFIPKPILPMTAHLLLSREIEKPNHGWQQGLLQSEHFMSFRVLATLWHLSQNHRTNTLRNPQARKIRTLPPPSAVVDQVTSTVPIGYSEHDGNHLPLRLPEPFFSHHTLIAGKSAEGKSAFIRHLGHSAMAQGGLVLIDPYGDLCEGVLKIVPLDRAEDVVLIDLSDSTASVGLNPLDVTLGLGRDRSIANLLKMLAHIWVSNWGTKLENVFEMSLRTLFEANKILVARNPQDGPKQQYTLLDVSPLLTNAKFCHSVLQLVQDDDLRRWWREYYEPSSFAQQRNIISPLITKVAKFEGTSARRIIGQGASTLDLAQMIGERKIILLKLAKGVVGDDIASLVGTTILGLIQLTLGEQSHKVESQRRQARLPIIIDEFEMLLGSDYGMLAELHKYGATFFLSCQSLEHIQKLNPLLLSTVQANVKQLIAFRMSVQDAKMLHKELGVERDDLIHLDVHSCYMAILAADRRLPTFSFKVVPPPNADAMVAESIRTRCRVRYTYPVDEVDAMLRASVLRPIRQAPLSRERKNKSAQGALGTSSKDMPRSNESLFISDSSNKKTRFFINDTQPLPFTKEFNTGELEIDSCEEYRSRTEVLDSREKPHGNPLDDSAKKTEIAEKLELMEFETPRIERRRKPRGNPSDESAEKTEITEKLELMEFETPHTDRRRKSRSNPLDESAEKTEITGGLELTGTDTPHFNKKDQEKQL
jgi:hypothetical protein